MSRGNRRQLLVGLLVAAALSSLSLAGCSGSGQSGPPTLRSIAITPVNATISVGSNQQFSAEGTYSDGSVTDITSSVSWSSSDQTIASISSSGLAAAVAIGRPQLTATSGGIAVSTRLIVVEGTRASVPRFAYTVNVVGEILAYTVDAASGQLRANGYVDTGFPLQSITTDPAGKFAYALIIGGGVWGVFSIDPAAGGLTLIPNSAIAGSPTGAVSGIAIDPSGCFAYLPDALIGTMVYAINRASGIMTYTTLVPSVHAMMAFHPSGRFAYVTDGYNGISVYEIDVASGALTSIAGSPFATSGGVGDIGIDPAGKFAIASVYNGASSKLATFAIDAATGALTAASESPVPAGAVAISSFGTYVYVGDDSANQIWGFSMNSTTGDISLLPAAPFTTGSSPATLVADPSGKFLYIVNEATSSETIVTYAIDAATGNLSARRNVRTRGQSVSLAFSAGTAPVSYTPKYAYVANNADSTVSGYSINPATGGLTNVLGSPFDAGSNPATVTTDPAGKFLWAVNAAGGTISAFTVDQTSGVLSAVSGSPFAGGRLMLPFSIAVDPTGAFAYVTNSAPNSTTVSSFTIDRTTGALAPLQSLNAGTAPSVARVDPTGQFLYVTNAVSNSVSGFLIGQGAAGPVAGSPFLAGSDPLGLVIDPTGQFVYVANQVSNSVSAFRIDPATGALGEIAGSPYTTTGPLALAIDGTGSFLYVANHNASNNVSAYSIDPFTGAVTLLPGSPFTAGTGPNDIAVDFSGKFLYVANGGSKDVSVFSINALNGTLTQVSGSPFAAGSVPGSVVTTGQIQ